MNVSTYFDTVCKISGRHKITRYISRYVYRYARGLSIDIHPIKYNTHLKSLQKVFPRNEMVDV